MKTAMQEMIDKLNFVAGMIENPKYEMDFSHTISTLTKDAIELLESEKQQIEKAVIFGNRQEFYDATEKIGEFYYNQTFNK